MSANKISISEIKDYEAMGVYWDAQDLGDHVDQLKSAHFDVDIQSQTFYFAVEPILSKRLRASAMRKGVTAETLVNVWLQERIDQEAVTKSGR